MRKEGKQGGSMPWFHCVQGTGRWGGRLTPAAAAYGAAEHGHAGSILEAICSGYRA